MTRIFIFLSVADICESMPSIEKVSNEIIAAVNRLEERIGLRAWGDYSVVPFSHNLRRTKAELEEIRRLVAVVEREQRLRPVERLPGIEELKIGLQLAITKLGNNYIIEKETARNLLRLPGFEFNAAMEFREHQAVLEETVAKVLSETRLSAERMRAAARNSLSSPRP